MTEVGGPNPPNMLWNDDSDAPLADRIRRAAAYYQIKYGGPPLRCKVGGPDLARAHYLEDVDGIRVILDVRIPAGHLWLSGYK